MKRNGGPTSGMSHVSWSQEGSISRWRLVASPPIGARARCAQPPTPRRCCILPGGRICSAYTRRILPCWKGIPLRCVTNPIFRSPRTASCWKRCERLVVNSVNARRILHIPADFVVDQWASDGESSSHRDCLCLHSVRTTSERPSSHAITSSISMDCVFTTKSGGIWDLQVEHPVCSGYASAFHLY